MMKTFEQFEKDLSDDEIFGKDDYDSNKDLNKDYLKEDVYTRFRNHYLTTGHGVDSFFVDEMTEETKNVINELVDDRRLKIVNLYGNDVYCLTGVYCVEEEEITEPNASDFISMYLDIFEDEGNLFYTARMTYFAENPEKKVEWYNSYEKWLNKNKDVLERSFNK